MHKLIVLALKNMYKAGQITKEQFECLIKRGMIMQADFDEIVAEVTV